MTEFYGSLEAGGTKFVVAIGNKQGDIIEQEKIPTTTPKETIESVIVFFEKFKDLKSIAIGSFGPIDLDTASETYGFITNTPKHGWKNVNLVGMLKDALHVPIYFTTDVNSSAYGEVFARNRTGQFIENLVYYTVGTGVGAGILQRGAFIGGVGHPEMGHVYVAKHPTDIQNDFKGVCPFHTGCLEGLCCGPSLEARCGVAGENLSEDNPVWDIEAYYLAQAAVLATVSFRPDMIVFGGGVMAQPHMLSRVNREFQKLLNGYISIPDNHDYIDVPYVKENGSATLGNFILAQNIFSSCSHDRY